MRQRGPRTEACCPELTAARAGLGVDRNSVEEVTSEWVKIMGSDLRDLLQIPAQLLRSDVVWAIHFLAQFPDFKITCMGNGQHMGKQQWAARGTAPLPALHASPLLELGGGMQAELRNDLGVIWGEVQGNISGRERVEEGHCRRKQARAPSRPGCRGLGGIPGSCDF